MMIAHELAAYREVLAAAIRACRPAVRVMVVPPADLAAALRAAAPRLVVASHAPPAGAEPPRVWVELYPGGQNYAVVHRDGGQQCIEDIDFDTILALVDELGLDERDRPTV